MKIAFYYHITANITPEGVFVPAFLGVFLDSLSGNCDDLIYVVHQSNNIEKIGADYSINLVNVQIVNLGLKTPAWHREIFHKKILKNRLKAIIDCDVFIVRSPTPLAPHFHKYLKEIKIWFMVVGDYLEAIDHLKKSTFRNKLVYYYLHFNDYFFQKRAKVTPLLVNSPALFDKYKKFNSKVFQIKTTTLSNADFFYRADTCEGSLINILYAGSFSIAKGIFELLDVLRYLKEDGLNVHLHMVGWENDLEKPIENSFKSQAIEMGLNSDITFHGKKKVGIELYSMYRQADIYVLPSHHEGFPRTIWEAMANGAPVVTTKVGGIPRFLTNDINSILVEPKMPEEFAMQIKRIINNKSLRSNIIKNAYELVKDNTLEIQTKKLVEIIKNNQYSNE